MTKRSNPRARRHSGVSGNREDQTQEVQHRLEALLLEGLRSNVTEITSADWADIRREALHLFEERKARLVT